MNVNLDCCHSKKSKFIDEQCLHKRKPGEYFCGIHLKSIKKSVYSPIVQMGVLHSNGTVPQPISPKYDEICYVDSEDEYVMTVFKKKDHISSPKDRIIYDNRFLFFQDLFENQKSLSVFTLRQSIHKLDLTKYIGSTKKSHSKLIDALSHIYQMEKRYHSDLDKIIKVQSFIRKIITKEYYLKKCRNETDIISFDDIWDIPKNHLYIFWDKQASKEQNENVYYAYDIRTIHHILHTETPTFLILVENLQYKIQSI